MSNLELKVPPVIVLLIFSLIMWLTSLQVSQGSLYLPYSVFLISIFFVVGAVFALSGVLSFRKAKTTVNPMKPNNSTSVVNSGIYRISRNPMYVGFLFILLGWSVFLANILVFVFLPLYILYMNRFQIIPEEKILISKFGAKYTTYQYSVRRWL